MKHSLLLKNYLKRLTNKNFSAKYLLTYGIHLGGHKSSLFPESSSIVFGLRTQNMVINLNLTSLELQKTLNISRGLGTERSIVYFVNSNMGFRLSFKSCFQQFNQHLFFRQEMKINSVFQTIKDTFLNKKDLAKIRKSKQFLKKQTSFLFRSGKTLLRKIYIASKWSYGFVSNGSSFFAFAENVLHEQVKYGKVINTFEDKINSLVDIYPFLPNYGFIGDHRTNFWIVNEFSCAKVPSTSVMDPFTHKGLLAVYGIPGNACSTDSMLFFVILVVANYLLGFYQQMFKFCFKTFIKLNITKNKKKFFFKNKKNFFFKNLNIFLLK